MPITLTFHVFGITFTLKIQRKSNNPFMYNYRVHTKNSQELFSASVITIGAFYMGISRKGAFT